MEKNGLENFESDKNSSAPHPRKTVKLIGHVHAREMFINSYQSGKLHHAWLLHGPKGIGKATLAWELTKILLNNSTSPKPGDPNHKTLITQRIEALSEPSIFLCRKQFDKTRKKFSQDISVDEVRKINHFFSLSNPDNLWRIVIIDPVDDLSNSAANALLKILEEPPEGGMFFLICKNKEKVIPTILSRCRLLSCSFLEQDEFTEILSQLKIFDHQQVDRNQLFCLTNGSISKAIDMFLNDGLNMFKEILGIINFENEMDRKKIWSLLSQKNNSGLAKEYPVFIGEALLLALTRISTALAGKNHLWQLIEEKEIIQFYKKYDASYFPFAWIYSSLLLDLKNTDQTNLDPLNTLFIAFLKIEKVLLKFKMTSQRKN
ncbi:MAG: DNA polymerase III subunit delta' [Paracoccaceae bacterium]|nr:DNA polymerase III subunit delta' [Paracoccaceae bacterium]